MPYISNTTRKIRSGKNRSPTPLNTIILWSQIRGFTPYESTVSGRCLLLGGWDGMGWLELRIPLAYLDIYHQYQGLLERDTSTSGVWSVLVFNIKFSSNRYNKHSKNRISIWISLNIIELLTTCPIGYSTISVVSHIPAISTMEPNFTLRIVSACFGCTISCKNYDDTRFWDAKIGRSSHKSKFFQLRMSRLKENLQTKTSVESSIKGTPPRHFGLSFWI